MGIALAAAAALKQDVPVALGDEIQKLLAGVDVVHRRTRRYLDHDVVPAGAVLLSAGAGAAVLRKKTPPHLEIRQRFHVGLDREHDIATASPVSAVRTALWNVLLAPERYRSCAAVSRAYLDLRFVCEQRGTSTYSPSTGRIDTSFLPRRV